MADWKQQISSYGRRVFGIPLVSVALVSVVVAMVAGLGSGAVGGGSFLQALLSTAATVLLVAVAAASRESGHRWREWIRHDSIRADIAAAGGLDPRLMV